MRDLPGGARFLCFLGPALGSEHHERGVPEWPLTAGKSLLGVSSADVARFITTIRNYAAEKNRADAKAGFESAKQSEAEMNCCIHNTVRGASIACQDIKATEERMDASKQEGMTDVASLNTLSKAHLQLGGTS